MTRAAFCAKVSVKFVSMCNLSRWRGVRSRLAGRCSGTVTFDKESEQDNGSQAHGQKDAQEPSREG